MRDVTLRLKDVLTAIENIEKEAHHGRTLFETDPKVQVWMLYHNQLIGEAVRSVVDELKTLNPAIPWALIVGMRHILVHNYFGIDLNEVWNVVERDMVTLKPAIIDLLAQLTDKSPH